jgi:hypothetical protein
VVRLVNVEGPHLPGRTAWAKRANTSSDRKRGGQKGGPTVSAVSGLVDLVPVLGLLDQVLLAQPGQCAVDLVHAATARSPPAGESSPQRPLTLRSGET